MEDISWKPPVIGWICSNTDGDNVEWICRFSNGLGSCDAYVAELWGASEGSG
ncbi:hypothetical protein MTR_1g111470 [Medicago truncatula]|uniref:Uncharacterized protein n=1 Tax=Medicago truncatula TaxID=3880 RepID=G7ZZB1_MEDTR|nr:hypothetical protein MTR_1g111470 [Medicago truncatula]